MGELLLTNDISLTSQAGGAVNSNQRNFISKASICAFGSRIRIQIKGHDTTDCTLSGCSIGPANASYNYSATPTRVTFNDGSNSTTQPHGSSIWSDWIDYDLNPATDHVIHLAYTSGSIYVSYGAAATGNSRCYRDYSTDDTMAETVSGYSADGYFISVTALQIETTDDSKKRYRLFIYGNDGNASYYALSELALKLNGVNQCSGGYPRALSQYSNWYSSRAFDSNAATAWATPIAYPSWIEYEFPVATDIDEYSITARADSDWNQTPASWILCYWDGTKWLLVGYQASQTSWTQGQTRSFELPEAGYFMVSKVVGYAVLSPIQPALNISKLVGYAVLGPGTPAANEISPIYWVF